MRTPLIVGNWASAVIPSPRDLAAQVCASLSELTDVEVCLCPAAVDLREVAANLHTRLVTLGAQGVSEREGGEWTGELTADMLKRCGCSYVLVGHAASGTQSGAVDGGLRRIRTRAAGAVRAGLTPIICCSDTAEDRAAGVQCEKLAMQVKLAVEGLTADDVESLVLAYQPLWAEGDRTGCDPAEANAMARYVRQIIREAVSPDAASGVRILYGGSLDHPGPEAFLEMSEVDGALVDGRSRDADYFKSVCQAASFAAWNFYI